MYAAYLTAYGGHEVVEFGELPLPTLNDNQALIAVHAASVNPVELAIRAGRYPQLMPLTFPHIPGFDFSGVVINAPDGCGFKPDDEVYARLPGNKQGAYAEIIAVPTSILALKPKTISHIVTATAGPANQAFIKEIGADQALDYTRDHFENFGPYDVIYDGVCGDLVEKSIMSLKPGGRYVGLVMVSDARAYISIGLPEPMAKAAAAAIGKIVLDLAGEGKSIWQVRTQIRQRWAAA